MFRKFLVTFAAAAAFTATATISNYVKDCSYNASNTNTTKMNYVLCPTEICKNEIFTFDGCSCTGDTYFRLYQNGSQIITSDDACNICSKIQFQRYEEGCQTYELRMGCFTAHSCSANVSVYKDIAPPPPSLFPTMTPSLAPSLAPTPPIVSLHFDGGANALNIVVAPGDTVTYTATYSPFSINSMEFSVSNVSSHSHTYPTESIDFFTITDSIYRNGNGAVAVRTPAYYNSRNYYYYIYVGQFIRWQWNEFETPSYPTFFYGGSDYYPGLSRYGTNYYDFLFVIPGYYYWYSSSWNYYYQVIVYDPFETSHYNIKWGIHLYTYDLTISSDDLLVFYASDGYKHNVRIVDSRTFSSIWLSNDFALPGEYQTLTLSPGTYYASCDYHPSIFMTIYVTGCPNNEKNDENNKDLIPKIVYQAAEISLLMIGIVGFSELLFNTARKNKPDHSKPSITSMNTQLGDQISRHAHKEMKEREGGKIQK